MWSYGKEIKYQKWKWKKKVNWCRWERLHLILTHDVGIESPHRATTTLLSTGHGNIACFLPVSPFSRHLVLTHVINVVSDLVISFIHSQHLFILYLLITNVLCIKHMIREKERYIAYYDVFMLDSIVRRCWVEKNEHYRPELPFTLIPKGTSTQNDQTRMRHAG